MKLPQIIISPLETDMYKLSMGQAILHQFPSYEVEWTFKCRNKDVKFTPEMIQEIREQIDAYCGLHFLEEELKYLETIEWIRKDFIDWLRLWHPRREEILINEMDMNIPDCGLAIKARGTWLNTTFYEIAILAIVNEVYFAFKYGNGAKMIECQKATFEKFEKLFKGEYEIGPFSEFGLRRRYSGEFQDWLVGFLSEAKKKGDLPGFVGTSNVALAMKYSEYGIKPVGTMAHEFIMCSGQGDRKNNPAYSNWHMMDSWVKEYGTLNGIALTDTIGTEMFLKDFRKTFATLFSGVRHDSGDPVAWGERMLDHYARLGIDPKTKTLLFSDSLDFERATKLYRHFKDKAGVAFGIGTYLSNPLSDPLNIVMKITKCNGGPVAKLSDTPGKGMCEDEEYIAWVNSCLNLRQKESV